MATYQIETEGGTYQVDTEEQKTPDFMGAIRSAGKTAISALPTPSQGISQVPGLTSIRGGMDSLSEQIKGQAKKATGFNMPIASDIAFDPRTYIGLGGGKQAVSGAIESGVAENFAGKLVNSLIKPQHKQFMFGKNPGLGIAKEGIADMSLSGLGNKVEQRLGEIKQAVSDIRGSADNAEKVLDLRESLKPFSDALSKLMKAPKSNAEEIKRVSTVVKDIVGLQEKPLESMNLKDAYELKDVIKNLQSWKSESMGGNELNTALRKSYHNIDSAIDQAVPELSQYNERMANLISAKQAIAHRIEILSKHEPLSWGNILDLPLKAFKSTAIKSGLAKMLVEKYPAIR